MTKKAKVAPPERRTLFARIPVDQYKRLKLLAVHREVRVGELVREALDRFLNKEAPDGKP
jgi:hypothetical protein